ncbi:MAG TPA: hypothetical protein VGG86_04975 [Roseiarcus sp.]|jgi:hypothetical protein
MSDTLAEAAAACGLDKSTVRSGRISGTRDEGGVWHVEPVELHRVFPPAAQRTEGNTTATPRDAPADAAATAALKSERDAAADALVAELRGVNADLRQDRDHWREQAQRLALPAPQPVAAARRPWWSRLRMTG